VLKRLNPIGPQPDKKMVEVVIVRTVQTFLNSCSGLIRKTWTQSLAEVEVIRQGTPPDEAQAEYDEWLAEMSSAGTRWETLAPELN
jgi:hypothetical protein